MKKLLSIILVFVASLNVALADDLKWGYYSGEGAYDDASLGLFGTGQTGAVRVAIFVPGNGVLKGGSISAINLPILDAEVLSNISVWVSNGTSLNSHAVDKTVTSVDENNIYTKVNLDTPVQIPANGCFVGYTFTVTSVASQAGQYPIINCTTNKTEKSLYLYYDNQWADYGPDYGASILQVFVSGVTLPDVAASFGEIQNGLTAINTTSTWPVTINSNGKEDVTGITYTIDANGVSETREAAVNIPGGLNQSATLNVDLKSPATVGDYAVKMAITKVNGKDNSLASDVTTSVFTNVSRIVDRKTVVEEFTGTGCQYCPRGMVGMELMRETFGDKFIGIALHQYNVSSDPMGFSNWRKVGFDGAPQCAIDGREVMDPYYGSSETPEGILSDFSRYNSLPALAAIDMKATWTDETKTSVKVTSNIEALVDDDYEVAYALVADGLQSTQKAWGQSNYYARYAASQIGDSNLTIFSKDGEYGTTPCYPVFNDVAVSSSYSGTTNMAAPLGHLVAGTPVESTFTMDLPTKETLATVLRGAVNSDKVYAVAVVFDSTGAIAQAEKVAVATEGAGFKYDLAISANGFATVYDENLSYALPVGASAMVVDGIADGKLSYKTIAVGSSSNNVVPAGTAAIIVDITDAGKTITLTSVDEAAPYQGENLLGGCNTRTYTSGPEGSLFYKLSYSNDGQNLGWYWGAANGEAFVIEAHKAWLAIPATAAASVRSFALDASNVTAIAQVENGELKVDNSIYNIAGCRVNNVKAKGVYIINGKKIVK